MEPDAAADPVPQTIAELASDAFARQRFEAELEFVQLLANPFYLNRKNERDIKNDCRLTN